MTVEVGVVRVKRLRHLAEIIFLVNPASQQDQSEVGQSRLMLGTQRQRLVEFVGAHVRDDSLDKRPRIDLRTDHNGNETLDEHHQTHHPNHEQRDDEWPAASVPLQDRSHVGRH